MLDICKARVINRIKLITEEPRRPTKYKLSIRTNRDTDWEDIGEYDNLDVRLLRPRKFAQVKWTVSEPTTHVWLETNMTAAWAIFDIRLTEVRLFGRWWHKVIEE